jgi:predicted transcriptional regulator
METLRARVRNGRLVLDEPTSLSEGTEIELAVADPGDDLDDDQRARLHESIERGIDDARAGRTIPAEDVIAELKKKR